jgi:hypothetical protein
MSELKATPEDIVYAYRLLLGREPDDKGLQHFLRIVSTDNISTLELARCFLNSQECDLVHKKVTPGTISEPINVKKLVCRPCTQKQLESSSFRYWAGKLHERPGYLHRKLWEWCFITQALHERGMLHTGRKGLGFAVGREPLTSQFAGMGCHILATDLDFDSAAKEGWVDGNQHAAGIENLNDRGLCDAVRFSENVRFRSVDMRAIPADLSSFDFLWSSCSLEHLGGLDRGIDFVLDAMKCLRPGGVAVHTTEFNVDSDTDTIETGHDVIYRRCDFLRLAKLLTQNGHHVEPFDFDLGDMEADRIVDEPPYTAIPHLKLRIGDYASTSFGLIITKSES